MKGRILTTLLGVLVPVAGAIERTIPLTVDGAGVRLAEPFPVTGGIPFGRGELTDVTRVRVSDEERELPLQTEVLARWPDGSVKWLLLDVQVPPGTDRLQLRYGPKVPPRPLFSSIRAGADGEKVEVDTGPLAFTVRRDGHGFLDAVRFRGREMRLPPGVSGHTLDAVHVESPSAYPPNQRYVQGGVEDPATVIVDEVVLETRGPLRATVRIDGRYQFRLLGSTIEGTEVRGDCPFRIRIHAYAGRSYLKVEHFFCYEGDGDHDFVRELGLRVPIPAEIRAVRVLGDDVVELGAAPLSGLCQETPDHYWIWSADWKEWKKHQEGWRFEGVLEAVGAEAAVAVGGKDFWQNAPKALRIDRQRGVAEIALWPVEAAPLDLRRHAREWSVGETGAPDDPEGREPVPFGRSHPFYRLASKGMGKTHYAVVGYHDPGLPVSEIRGVHRLFDQRPLLWAPPRYYAATRALGRYRERVPGEYEAVEQAMDLPIRFWRVSREKEGWYGFLLYGNVPQSIHQFLPTGRWDKDFGRWGWSNGDSMGRLGYALMLQALRTARREDFAFAEAFVYHVHDVCSTHSPAYPVHYRDFRYVKGASHRHGAWPWACPYIGVRGSHPLGAKIHYFLTGEGRLRDILETLVELALRNPNGGMGDGPLGPNAQAFLYKWETTGADEWREKVRQEILNSGLARAQTGWEVMMNAAFGIYNALEEYMELTGDDSLASLAAKFADASMPEKMKNHWTWAGYYRVYAAAYQQTGDPRYADAIREMLPKFVSVTMSSVVGRLPEKDWPGPPGSPTFFADGNAMRDLPFAIEALETAKRRGQEGTP